MAAGVGPLDGRRARRTRCEACARRKIKCHGGSPCDYCKRTSQTCKWPSQELRPNLVFVHEKIRFKDARLSDTQDESDLAYFVTSFLPVNLLAARRMLALKDLQDLLHVSPAFGDAVKAVAILHRSFTAQTAPSKKGSRELQLALQTYGRSVQHIQQLVLNSAIAGEPHALWSTFILGLFELMRDVTGTNWVAHFLYGTCTMLRLQHPTSLIRNDPKSKKIRDFFLATRIFEIARSLIYTEPTFLNETEWTDALAALWQNDGDAFWHPKEGLFDILPRFSDLAIRALNFSNVDAESLSLEDRFYRAQALGTEGLILQEMLSDWWHNAMRWVEVSQHNATHTSQEDVDIIIARIYFHAISIYLSGIFDYHDPWTTVNAPCAPILRRQEVENHVREIIRLSRELLAAGVAGVLLFFPLRVAGARSMEDGDQKDILLFFDKVAGRGYNVAEAFVNDLQALWASSSLKVHNATR